MQTAIITVDLTLCALAFAALWMQMGKTPQKFIYIVKNALLPGAMLGVIAAISLDVSALESAVSLTVLGLLTGEITVAFYFAAGQACKEKVQVYYYDDLSPAKYYITGDKHRDFEYVKRFCWHTKTRKKDVLIVLGDAGLNYYGDERDTKLKQEISGLDITLFCLHGNKENRPQNIVTYGQRSFCGGMVMYEPKYPNILFAIDGEIYTFEGKKYLVVGGAHSVDKLKCLEEGKPFWYDEMPDCRIKARVEQRLEGENYSIFGMLTHTCPIDYLPTEMFVSTRQCEDMKNRHRRIKAKHVITPDIDRSTEQWLGEIEKKLDYSVWYCGHYHIDKPIDKINMMYREIRPLHMQLFGEQ